MEPKRQDFQTQIKPVSRGTKKQFTVTTPHGVITRTTARDYQAVAYSVSSSNEVLGTSFSATLQGAYNTARSWKSQTVYYGELLTDTPAAQPTADSNCIHRGDAFHSG